MHNTDIWKSRNHLLLKRWCSYFIGNPKVNDDHPKDPLYGEFIDELMNLVLDILFFP